MLSTSWYCYFTLYTTEFHPKLFCPTHPPNKKAGFRALYLAGRSGLYACEKHLPYANTTRQLSYRKDDRAMRPIYGCPIESWVTSPRLLFSKFVMGVYFKNVRTKLEVRRFTRSWDNRGYSKNFGSPWIRPRSFFSQIFKGLLFAWNLRIYLPNLKFVALPNPEIIGGTVIWRLLSR